MLKQPIYYIDDIGLKVSAPDQIDPESKEYLLLFVMAEDNYREWTTAKGRSDAHEAIAQVYDDIDLESSLVMTETHTIDEFVTVLDFLTFLYHNNLIPEEDRLFMEEI